MKVHSALGNGFQEVIYQRALAIELEIEKKPFNFGERSLKIKHLINKKFKPSD